MFKLDLEKAEEAEIKLPISIILLKRQENSRKTFAFDQAKAFDSVIHKILWKTLQEMGIPDQLSCLLRNLYAAQEATVRTRHRTTDWFPVREGMHQGCILSPCLFNLYAEDIMKIAGLDEAEAGIKSAGTNNNDLMQMTAPLWQKMEKN